MSSPLKVPLATLLNLTVRQALQNPQLIEPLEGLCRNARNFHKRSASSHPSQADSPPTPPTPQIGAPRRNETQSPTVRGSPSGPVSPVTPISRLTLASNGQHAPVLPATNITKPSMTPRAQFPHIARAQASHANLATTGTHTPDRQQPADFAEALPGSDFADIVCKTLSSHAVGVADTQNTMQYSGAGNGSGMIPSQTVYAPHMHGAAHHRLPSDVATPAYGRHPGFQAVYGDPFVPNAGYASQAPASSPQAPLINMQHGRGGQTSVAPPTGIQNCNKTARKILPATGKKVHKRVYKACLNCRKRKVKCDQGNPDDPDTRCARCIRERLQCTLPDVRSKASPTTTASPSPVPGDMTQQMSRAGSYQDHINEGIFNSSPTSWQQMDYAQFMGGQNTIPQPNVVRYDPRHNGPSAFAPPLYHHDSGNRAGVKRSHDDNAHSPPSKRFHEDDAQAGAKRED